VLIDDRPADPNSPEAGGSGRRGPAQIPGLWGRRLPEETCGSCKSSDKWRVTSARGEGQIQDLKFKRKAATTPIN
jgi:hypothetical protein